MQASEYHASIVASYASAVVWSANDIHNNSDKYSDCVYKYSYIQESVANQSSRGCSCDVVQTFHLCKMST